MPRSGTSCGVDSRRRRSQTSGVRLWPESATTPVQDAEAGEPAEIRLAGAGGHIVRAGGHIGAEGRRARAAADQRRAAPIGRVDRRLGLRAVEGAHQPPGVAVAEVDDIRPLHRVGERRILRVGARADRHGGDDADATEAIGGVLRLVVREAFGGGRQEGDGRALAGRRRAEEAEMEAVEGLRECVAADEDEGAGHRLRRR